MTSDPCLKPSLDTLAIATRDEFLPAIGLWIRAGGLLLVATVGAGFALAALTKFNAVVQAPAKVRPGGEVRLVEAATAGVVSQLLVQEHQMVEAGAAIATLDDSQLRTQTAQMQQQITQAEQEIQRIQAQLTALEAQASAQAQQSHQAILADQSELALTAREYQDQQLQSVAQAQEANANVQSAEREWHRAQQDLEVIQANLEAAQVSLRAARVKQNRYQHTAALGALSQDQLAEVQLSVKQQEQAVKGQLAMISAQKETIANRYQLLKAMQAKLDQVQTGLNPSQGKVEIAKARIDEAKSVGASQRAELQQGRERLLSQKGALQNQLIRDRKHLTQLQHDHQQTVIKAPVRGKILQLVLRNPGQVVNPGDLIAKVFPQDAALTVKAKVATQDIGKFHICTAPDPKTCVSGLVQLRLSAYPYPEYGTLKGVIRHIAEDTSDFGENKALANYEVTIQPEKLFLTKGNRKYPLQSGMEATADILTQRETFLEFFLRKARLSMDPS